MTRAKFFLVSKTEYAIQNVGRQSFSLEFQPVYGDTEENKKFWHATPSGLLKLHVKPEVAELFEPGKQYYIDITPAEIDITPAE